ncbi:hypothetical protein N7462_011244 [Penicillium macrosclerotiorum]|uniref:uncharacterized protein n=1 Tax=Penicillium macrosclerotiorum TaxID=303699 RepID=UPI002549A83B|nr:uncharacterized protein N7462_011244 [Penicillium macrosclerotiorum]KAJ5666835.1 hypothetical protein N7462_011244 [Penicillium macrosclerotiorum]
MALGPTLGTGLFIGAGQALAIGGPASLLVSYIFLSLLTYFMATTVAEVASHSPTRHGTLVANGFRYMTTSLGFAAALLRWYTMAMFVPYEITTAVVSLGLWNKGSRIASRMLIIMSIIIGFNFLPERHFRSSERLFTRIKIGTLIFLLVLTLSIGLGGATGHDVWGFQYWRKPGAMHEYLSHGAMGKFWGLFQCLLHSSIAFTFTPELIVHRAETLESIHGIEIGEELDPVVQSSLPRKVAVDVATTVIPYVFSALAVGVMAPYDNPLLTNNGAGAGMSPFVVGINTARIRILPMTVTLAILLSSVASGRSFLYLSSRTLCAMAELGHAHQIFKVRNRWGIPYVAVMSSALFALLAFISIAASSPVTTTYFLVFVNSSGYLSWLVSCAIYRHFRRRLHLRGTTSSYRFVAQPFGTYFGAFVSAVLLLSNGLVGAIPGPRPGSRTSRLLAAYFSIPLFALLYFVHRFRDMIPYRSPICEPQEFCNKAASEGIQPQQRSPTGSPGSPDTLEMDQVWSMAMEA